MDPVSCFMPSPVVFLFCIPHNSRIKAERESRIKAMEARGKRGMSRIGCIVLSWIKLGCAPTVVERRGESHSRCREGEGKRLGLFDHIRGTEKVCSMATPNLDDSAILDRIRPSGPQLQKYHQHNQSHRRGCGLVLQRCLRGMLVPESAVSYQQPWSSSGRRKRLPVNMEASILLPLVGS